MPADEWRRVLAFRQMPDFLDGLMLYGEIMPEYFSNNMLLNKVVTEADRFHILVYALYLYDTRDANDPRTGLTLSNLQKTCKKQGVASSGRVMAILGIMQLAGYLTRKASVQDSRVVHLAPTPAFIRIVEGWNRAIFRIIDAVTLNDGLADSHVELPRLGWEMRRRGAETLLNGWYLLDAYPEPAHFINRDAGWMLLLHCVAQSLRLGERREIAPVSVELRSFGKRFGVSRSHLRRLLESAHAADLLEAPPRNGADIRLSPRLVASFLTCMASELSFCREHALNGREALLDAASAFPAKVE